jgi:nickel-dependent lactate racemase
MNEIQLRYGDSSFKFEFDQNRFEVLDVDVAEQPLTDIEIGVALETPIGGPYFDEAIGQDDSVLIVVSDATRATASAHVVNLFVRRLIQTGVSPANVAVIFATGIHRRVTQTEKAELLTPFILQRIRTIDHDALDQANLTHFGATKSGIPVVLNRALQEFSRIVVVGGVNFHYFAGFTGGRKSICPGLASAETIAATHLLALDFDKGGRRSGVGPGLLDGNAVNEECEEIAARVAPAFTINTIVGADKRAIAIYCGDWRQSHHAACEHYLRMRSRQIREKRDLVIVSCGGAPHDLNLIQAHKALEMASTACKDGGTIILLAECRDGLGRSDFLQWFDAPDSHSLEMRLKDRYEVNGQTAWSLMLKTERFSVHLISELAAKDVCYMKMEASTTLDDALQKVTTFKTGYLMPRGAAILPRISAAP